jgi:hypothetical protein
VSQTGRAATLRGWYPGLRVEGYLAMRKQQWLSFHQIDLSGRAGPGGVGLAAAIAPAWLMAIWAVGQPVACHCRAQARAEPLQPRLFWSWFPRHLL